ncbi:17168_t:CDS:2 [Cetraspora pellucida]|uniref:17168_t:CDS:1 n=1 Tax=Cetraspora pellucida TaxID=1433469 RepID=A0A9N9ILK2_9GLOM|nr:17168_t:CDS:2 [Cetraspora pellucida]
MFEFNFNQHHQQFINNINETHSVFNDSLALIQHYEAVISTYKTHNHYLVNLYNKAYEYFGISWKVFVENNKDYDYFKREVINHNSEEGSCEDCFIKKFKSKYNSEDNFDYDNYNEVYHNVFNNERKEHNKNYHIANINNFNYESNDDGHEGFLQKREYDSYESYLADKNAKNFEYYMSQYK